MSAEDLVRRFEVIDPSLLSEADRISVVERITAALDELSSKPKTTKTIALRMQLLGIWHKIAKLRIAHVRQDIDPPDLPVAQSTVFDEPEPEEASTDAEAPADILPGPAVVADEDHLPPEETYRKEDDLIPVRLIEAGIVNGMRLPAGIVVDVTQVDADHLIESGRARRLDGSEDRT
jgi:hypothetical protein